jgi:hypothetical protein
MRCGYVVIVTPLLLCSLGKSPTVGVEVLKGKNLLSILGIKTTDIPGLCLVTVLLWLQKHVGCINKIYGNDVTRCICHRVVY